MVYHTIFVTDIENEILKFLKMLKLYKFPQPIFKVTSLSLFSFSEEIGEKEGERERERERERGERERKRRHRIERERGKELTLL